MKKTPFFFITFLIVLSNLLYLSNLNAQIQLNPTAPSGQIPIPPTALSGEVEFLSGFGISDIDLLVNNDLYPVTLNSENKFELDLVINELAKFRMSVNHDYLDGVNVGDIIKIQNHILGKTVFDKPGKYLAADVNSDQAVSIQDIVEIRKLILGKSEKFSIGQSWRFFDGDFPLFNNNWNLITDYFNYNPEGNGKISFKAVKLGDLDLMAKPGISDGPIIRENRNVEFILNIPEENNDRFIEIPVTSRFYKDIRGFQCSIGFDQNEISLFGIKSGKIELEDNFYNLDKDGNLNIAYSSEESINLKEDEILFTILMEKISNASSKNPFNVNKAISTSAFDSEGRELNLSINQTSKSTQLAQNIPNPFQSETYITFNLNESLTALFQVFNVQGSVVYSKIIHGNKGLNAISIRKSDLDNRTGVLFYQLSDGKNSYLKKMVLLD